MNSFQLRSQKFKVCHEPKSETYLWTIKIMYFDVAYSRFMSTSWPFSQAKVIVLVQYTHCVTIVYEPGTLTGTSQRDKLP